MILKSVKISSSIFAAIMSMKMANAFFKVGTGRACAALAPNGAKATLVNIMQAKAARLI